MVTVASRKGENKILLSIGVETGLGRGDSMDFTELNGRSFMDWLTYPWRTAHSMEALSSPPG